MPTTMHQSKVSPDPAVNAELDDKQRLANLEADVVNLTSTMVKLVEQNDRYADYLHERMERERESHQFWVQVRMKLAVSGIWGTILLIGTAIAYAAKEWVHHG